MWNSDFPYFISIHRQLLLCDTTQCPGPNSSHMPPLAFRETNSKQPLYGKQQELSWYHNDTPFPWKIFLILLLTLSKIKGQEVHMYQTKRHISNWIKHLSAIKNFCFEETCKAKTPAVKPNNKSGIQGFTSSNLQKKREKWKKKEK